MKKEHIVLIINTSDNKNTVVQLSINDKKDVLKETSQTHSSQILLPMIVKILKRNKINFSDLSEIKLELGPGSFTGLRVGTSVANLIGWHLKIPVNGSFSPVKLTYH